MKPRRMAEFGPLDKVERTRVVTRTACGKRGYTSRKEAAAAAKRQSKATGELIRPYHCPHGCHCWHIGHPPGSRGEHCGARAG